MCDLADSIAYDNHDLDDGIASGILEEEALAETVLWREASEDVAARHPGLPRKARRLPSVRPRKPARDCRHAGARL